MREGERGVFNTTCLKAINYVSPYLQGKTRTNYIKKDGIRYNQVHSPSRGTKHTHLCYSENVRFYVWQICKQLFSLIHNKIHNSQSER